MAIQLGSGIISSLVKRFTNSKIVEQAMLEAPTLKNKWIETFKRRQSQGVVNLKAGELDSVTWIPDGGTLSTGSDVPPQRGTYDPAILFGRVAIPRGAAKVISSKEDGVDLVMDQMESCGNTFGRQIGRAVFGDRLGSPAAAVAPAATTFTVADSAGFRVGMMVEIYNGATLIETVKVGDISIPSDPSAVTTITLANAATVSAAWTTAYDFYLRGSRANGMINLADVCAAANLLGIDFTTDDYSGNLDTTTTTLSVEALQNLNVLLRRRRGSRGWDHIIFNSLNESRYSRRIQLNRRFPPGSKMDATGGQNLEFEGKPMHVDENVSNTDIFMINKDDVKLHEFWPIEPDTDGGTSGGGGMNRGAVLVSGTSFIYDAQFSCGMNLRPERRNGTARMSAITN